MGIAIEVTEESLSFVRIRVCNDDVLDLVTLSIIFSAEEAERSCVVSVTDRVMCASLEVDISSLDVVCSSEWKEFAVLAGYISRKFLKVFLSRNCIRVALCSVTTTEEGRNEVYRCSCKVLCIEYSFYLLKC